MSINKFFLILNIIFFIIFAGCIFWLFNMRFKTGDVYPPYSTLRADPLGAMALFESLNEIENIIVERNYDSISDFQKKNLFQPVKLTIFFLNSGFEPVYSKKYFNELKMIALNGGTVIIAFRPDFNEHNFSLYENKNNSDSASQLSSNNKEKNIKVSADTIAFDFFSGVGLKKFQKNNKIRFAEKMILESGENEIPCASNYFFDLKKNSWEIVYSIKNEYPVVIRRTFGKGSFIFIADSYLFSNEGLRKHPKPEFILQCLNSNAKIIFDESHIGVINSHGISSLIIKYRLHGSIICAFIVFLFFLWKRLSQVAPVYKNNILEKNKIVTGKDSITGLVNILRRHIDPKKIVTEGFEEWKKSQPKNNRKIIEKSNRMRDELNLIDLKKNPVDDYNRLLKIFNERR